MVELALAAFVASLPAWVVLAYRLTNHLSRYASRKTRRPPASSPAQHQGPLEPPSG